jgi:hypothetical protein
VPQAEVTVSLDHRMTARRAAFALCDFRKLSRRRPAAALPGFVFEVEREHFDDEDDADEDVAPGP